MDRCSMFFGKDVSRFRNLMVLFACCHLYQPVAVASSIAPSDFKVAATMGVDNFLASLNYGVATIAPRFGAPGYSWLYIEFYSFAPLPGDVVELSKGSTKSMQGRWYKTAADPVAYNKGHAGLKLTLDKGFSVGQVDMDIPGHSCTVVESRQDIEAFSRDYHFDGKQLRLKSRGSFVCDMTSMGGGKPKFSWDVDVNIPVYPKREE